MAVDLPIFLPSPLSKKTSHVPGSSVQIPEGQREAPSAEHCPAQLTPFPQEASSKVLSGLQQVTLLECLEKVKALSKKSTEGVFVSAVVVAVSPEITIQFLHIDTVE